MPKELCLAFYHTLFHSVKSSHLEENFAAGSFYEWKEMLSERTRSDLSMMRFWRQLTWQLKQLSTRDLLTEDEIKSCLTKIVRPSSKILQMFTFGVPFRRLAKLLGWKAMKPMVFVHLYRFVFDK
jgi:hypothetical protein